MINGSEDQITFIQHLRWLADGQIDDPAECVRSYHAALEKKNIQPFRRLEEDMAPTRRGAAYDSGKGTAVTPAAATSTVAVPQEGNGGDFAAMSAEEKIAWNRQRWDRILS